MELDENEIEINKKGFYRTENYDNAKIEKLAKNYKEILSLIDDNPDREELIKTPMRVAKSLLFLTNGYHIDPDKILEGALFKEEYRQMVIVKDIEIYSLCEHHLLPFFGKAHVAYIPNGYITGLSKIAKVVEAYARRLQVQERLTTDIRNCINKTLKPLGVGVVIEAQHMCMQMRGVQKQNSVTTTSAFTGAFLTVATREEFIHLISSKLH